MSYYHRPSRKREIIVWSILGCVLLVLLFLVVKDWTVTERGITWIRGNQNSSMDWFSAIAFLFLIAAPFYLIKLVLSPWIKSTKNIKGTVTDKYFIEFKPPVKHSAPVAPAKPWDGNRYCLEILVAKDKKRKSYYCSKFVYQSVQEGKEYEFSTRGREILSKVRKKECRE